MGPCFDLKIPIGVEGFFGSGLGPSRLKAMMDQSIPRVWLATNRFSTRALNQSCTLVTPVVAKFYWGGIRKAEHFFNYSLFLP